VLLCWSRLCLTILLAATPVAAQTASPSPAAETWKIDVTHSELSFKIRHLVSTVPGTFPGVGRDAARRSEHLAGGSVE
jgi:polyisoprenoid-binding protein YceI